MSSLKQYVTLGVCASGIFTAYFVQGLVQERIQLHTFGPNKEHFPELTFLQGAQGFTCFIIGALVLLFMKLLKGRTTDAALPHVDEYLKCAVTNTIGPACGILALKNISYPAQVLAKSVKPLAVMVSGTLFYGKKYSATEYACISAVAAGISMFVAKGSDTVATRLRSPNALMGYSLCALNLLLDGFTNANQDALMHRYPGISSYHMMTWINLWMSVLAGYVYFIAGDKGYKVIDFCQRHPEALGELLLFCLCGTVGQLFIFMSIRTFGSLTNTTVTTTRKFFSILYSVVWNGTVLLPNQWVGTFMVLGGLMAAAFTKEKEKLAAKAKARAAAAAEAGARPVSPPHRRARRDVGEAGAEGEVARGRSRTPGAAPRGRRGAAEAEGVAAAARSPTPRGRGRQGAAARSPIAVAEAAKGKKAR